MTEGRTAAAARKARRLYNKRGINFLPLTCTIAYEGHMDTIPGVWVAAYLFVPNSQLPRKHRTGGVAGGDQT